MLHSKRILFSSGKILVNTYFIKHIFNHDHELKFTVILFSRECSFVYAIIYIINITKQYNWYKYKYYNKIIKTSWSINI
jgi:hypothetical protein